MLCDTMATKTKNEPVTLEQGRVRNDNGILRGRAECRNCGIWAIVSNSHLTVQQRTVVHYTGTDVVTHGSFGLCQRAP
jgi:hypothetical protein